MLFIYIYIHVYFMDNLRHWMLDVWNCLGSVRISRRTGRFICENALREGFLWILHTKQKRFHMFPWPLRGVWQEEESIWSRSQRWKWQHWAQQEVTETRGWFLSRWWQHVVAGQGERYWPSPHLDTCEEQKDEAGTAVDAVWKSLWIDDVSFPMVHA